MVTQLKSFFNDVSKEMKKVSWSTREQLQESTVVVAVTCVIISVFVMLIDLGMTKVVEFLFKS